MGIAIVSTLLVYLGILFSIAYVIDKKSKLRKRLSNSPTRYALSLAVYCTAWTFFGSVGAASDFNLEFFTIYIGPIAIAPLMWLMYRKFIRISKSQGVSTLPELLALRYDKSFNLNRLVTGLTVLGIIPYIALQIAGIRKGVDTLLNWHVPADDRVLGIGFLDISLLITLGLGLFVVLFTTRSLREKAQNTGMMVAIAFESIIKLAVFIVFGLYISYWVNDSQLDLYKDVPSGGLLLNENNSYSEWFGMIVLSALAFLFLPRQFEVGVVEVNNEKQIRKAIWLFPLYLVLINLFVLPIAIVGNRLFTNSSVDADTYMLAIPLELHNPVMALIVLTGGFSAASGMIIVSTHAVSKMVSNSLLMPYFIENKWFLNRFHGKEYRIPVFFRRISIFLVLLLAYSYYKVSVSDFSLISIGLISFLAVAQFAPAAIGALFWKDGNKKGAFAGIISGFFIWFVSLILPTLFNGQFRSVFMNELFAYGKGNEGALITTVLFWSLLVNTLLYVLVSLFSRQSSLERNQAEIFVDILKYSRVEESSVIWKGQAFFPDIHSLLSRFLGEQKAKLELEKFTSKLQIHIDEKKLLDPRVVAYAERLLSGYVGASSARILVGSVVKEEKLSMTDIVHILEESQRLMELNKELKLKSEELKRATEALKMANNKLKETDLLKDEFLYTVTHEMRTPLTSIKALSEILEEDDEMPEETRKEFLTTIVKEADRMTRLISQVLDLENFESGKHQLQLEEISVDELVQHCANAMEEVFRQKNIDFQLYIQDVLPRIYLDYDRITQVILNLLANAAKFCDKENGKITLKAYRMESYLRIDVEDNGPGVKDEMAQSIFEKFFQARNQTIKKPKGSGLGLAISKKIIQLHEGRIWVETVEPHGARFSFTIPFVQKYD